MPFVCPIRNVYTFLLYVGVIVMSTTIEERVATLEKELTHLKQLIQGTRVEKDWRKTFGMSANDPGFDEMVCLGRKIREQDQDDGGC
jgi:hypothetical protein